MYVKPLLYRHLSSDTSFPEPLAYIFHWDHAVAGFFSCTEDSYTNNIMLYFVTITFSC